MVCEQPMPNAAKSCHVSGSRALRDRLPEQQVPGRAYLGATGPPSGRRSQPEYSQGTAASQAAGQHEGESFEASGQWSAPF